MTNLEKWNLKKEYLKTITDIFLENELIQYNLPKKLYEVSSRGEITKWEVVRFGYSHPYREVSYMGKNPTKKDIERIHNYMVNLKFSDSKILIYCKTNDVIEMTRVHYLKNVLEMITTEEEANIISKERKEKYDEYKKFCLDNAKSIYYDFNGNGYTYLGYMNDYENKSAPNEYLNCVSKGHKHIESKSKKYPHVKIFSCPICKIYWIVDSSD